MGDMGDDWKDHREYNRLKREKFGVPCPQCTTLQPKRQPTIMLPGQKCNVDGYVDRRHASIMKDWKPW